MTGHDRLRRGTSSQSRAWVHSEAHTPRATRMSHMRRWRLAAVAAEVAGTLPVGPDGCGGVLLRYRDHPVPDVLVVVGLRARDIRAIELPGLAGACDGR